MYIYIYIYIYICKFYTKLSNVRTNEIPTTQPSTTIICPVDSLIEISSSCFFFRKTISYYLIY